MKCYVPWRLSWSSSHTVKELCMSEPRQCPRVNSSTGIPGQTGSPTATLCEETGRIVRIPGWDLSLESKLSPQGDGNRNTGLQKASFV